VLGAPLLSLPACVSDGAVSSAMVLRVVEPLYLPVGLVGSAGPRLVLVVALVLIRRGLPHLTDAVSIQSGSASLSAGA
jgi:hypothetical protein